MNIKPKFLVTAKLGRDKYSKIIYTRSFAESLFIDYTEDKATEVLVWAWDEHEPLAKSSRGKIICNNL